MTTHPRAVCPGCGVEMAVNKARQGTDFVFPRHPRAPLSVLVPRRCAMSRHLVEVDLVSEGTRWLYGQHVT